MNIIRHPRAPALTIERWFNTSQPITLESLRGKVVVMESFQMLCPGCVSRDSSAFADVWNLRGSWKPYGSNCLWDPKQERTDPGSRRDLSNIRSLRRCYAGAF